MDTLTELVDKFKRNQKEWNSARRPQARCMRASLVLAVHTMSRFNASGCPVIVSVWSCRWAPLECCQSYSGAEIAVFQLFDHVLLLLLVTSCEAA